MSGRNTSPASSGQPRPSLAYAAWLDSLTTAGWDAKPAVEQVAVTGALGRVSAEPIVARWPSPRSDCAAMDGIAISAGGVSAGGNAVRLTAGTFEWIDTGDPMPDGADTVVMREWLLPQDDGSVVIGAGAPEPAHGKNVRRAGEDFTAGEVVVCAGRRLRPGDLATAAAAGHQSVAVTRRSVVAIIPTGDEIRPVGSAVRPGEIVDTNSLMLAGRCRQAGAVPVVSDVQPDDPDALAAQILLAALDADLVLVIAGSSQGRDDHAGAVLARVGGVAVAGVAVRPGHPALLGHAKRPMDGLGPSPGVPGRAAAPPAADRGWIAPVIGLPGYPLAAAVIFELFAVPLLAAIAGVRRPARSRLLATLDRDWTSSPGIEDWLLVTLAPAADSPTPAPPLATPTRRGAGSISQLARADAWWPISPDRVAFTAGAVIEVLPIPDGAG